MLSRFLLSLIKDEWWAINAAWFICVCLSVWHQNKARHLLLSCLSQTGEKIKDLAMQDLKIICKPMKRRWLRGWRRFKETNEPGQRCTCCEGESSHYYRKKERRHVIKDDETRVHSRASSPCAEWVEQTMGLALRLSCKKAPIKWSASVLIIEHSLRQLLQSTSITTTEIRKWRNKATVEIYFCLLL